MKRKPEEKPLQPIPRKMLADLLPGLRYAIRQLQSEGNFNAADSLEWTVAWIVDGKIPPFLEQDAEGGE